MWQVNSEYHNNYTVQVTLNLNARKTCTCRKLAYDTFVVYETHAKPCMHKDMHVLA